MAIRRFHIMSGLITAIALPAAAQGQGLPDLNDSVTRSSQVDRTVKESLASAVQDTLQGDNEIDGEAGIYVLTLNEIFRVSASGAIGYTDNPEKTVDTLGGDGFFEGALTAGIVTRLGEQTDFSLAASIGGREFLDRQIASNRNFSGTVSLGTPIVGPLYLGVVGYGGWNYNGDFKNGVSFHGVGANFSALLPVHPSWALRPGVGISRQYSQEKENTSTTASGSIELFYQLAPNVTATARGAVSRRWFDDFYEDVTFVTRKDWNYAINGSASWHLSRAVTVSASAGYERQDSTFFLATYGSYETAALVSLLIDF